MTDFNTPTNTSTYTSVLSTLNNKISSVAKLLFTSDTNLPAETIQYNRTNRVLEEWNGTTWVEKRIEPAGIIKQFAGTAAPRGHLLCDGSAVSRTTYAELFATIGTTYGVGNGSTTFNLPNLKGRFPLGKSDSGTGSVLAATGGAIDHTHTVKPHYHGMGAGANLSVDISHAHADSSVYGSVGGADGGHTHGVNDPGHTHGILARKGTINTDNSSYFPAQSSASSSNDVGRATQGSGTGISINSTNSGHGHGFSLAAYGQTLGETQRNPKTETVIGLVTGGVDGNSNQETLAANPPFLVVNYIITF